MGKKSPAQRLLLFVFGIIFLVGGITLVLVWWNDLLVLVRGAVPAVVAVAGLTMLYMIRD